MYQVLVLNKRIHSIYHIVYAFADLMALARLTVLSR